MLIKLIEQTFYWILLSAKTEVYSVEYYPTYAHILIGLHEAYKISNPDPDPCLHLHKIYRYYV